MQVAETRLRKMCYIQSNLKYSGMLTVKCEKNGPYEIILKNASEKFFNVIAKKFVSETNSLTQQEET